MTVRSPLTQLTKPFLRTNQQLRGALTEGDRFNRPLQSYADDYELRGLKPGQQIEITVKSAQIDTYLQLFSTTAQQPLLIGEDILENTNSRLVFTVKAGVRYRVRVSRSPKPIRFSPTGNYVLRSRTFPAVAEDFNFFYGYGLINAASAVARAVGQPPFADINFATTPNYDDQLDAGADLIQAPEVWQQGITGKGIVVAVIDTGVDYTEPDLRDAIWSNPGEIPGNGIDDDGNRFIDDTLGWNFVDDTNDPMDTDGHGTAVAGIIASSNLGIAYKAQIMPIRVLGQIQTKNAIASPIAAAIRYAVTNGAKVINLSLGGYAFDEQEAIALTFARQSGVVVVASAGNERQTLGAIQPSEPALFAMDHLAIAVGAVDRNRRVADFSNPAGKTKLNYVVAPGDGIYSIKLSEGGYSPQSGTSFAAPFVSSVAALMLSANPSLTPAQIEEIIISTANPQAITLTP